MGNNKHQQPPQVGVDRQEVAYNVNTDEVDGEVDELTEDFEGFKPNSALPETTIQPITKHYFAA